MAISYNRTEYIANLESKLRKETVSALYTFNEINYKGKTKDTREFYTEVFAEWLLSNLDILKGIKQHNRTLPYKVASHELRDIPTSNRTEEIIAITLFKNRNNPTVLNAGFGTILDYQVPLKVHQHDKAGKIDLLSSKGNEVYVLELKKQDSTETMLRCVLESFTYSKMLVRNKLLKEYEIDQNALIIPTPLVFENSLPHLEYDINTHPKLLELIKVLGIKPIILSKTFMSQLV